MSDLLFSIFCCFYFIYKWSHTLMISTICLFCTIVVLCVCVCVCVCARTISGLISFWFDYEIYNFIDNVRDKFVSYWENVIVCLSTIGSSIDEWFYPNSMISFNGSCPLMEDHNLVHSYLWWLRPCQRDCVHSCFGLFVCVCLCLCVFVCGASHALLSSFSNQHGHYSNFFYPILDHNSYSMPPIINGTDSTYF